MKLTDARDAGPPGLSSAGDFDAFTPGAKTSEVAASASERGAAEGHARGTRSTTPDQSPDEFRANIRPKATATTYGGCLAGADEFAINIRRSTDGWMARCMSHHGPLEASGGTPGQALSRMTRVINRHLHRHHRARPAARESRTMPLDDSPGPAPSASSTRSASMQSTSLVSPRR
jgi:hypothetical protein